MKVIYKASMLETIKNEIALAEIDGRVISRIELTKKEMDTLVYELEGVISNSFRFCPRTVPFNGFDVVEVFNAE